MNDKQDPQAAKASHCNPTAFYMQIRPRKVKNSWKELYHRLKRYQQQKASLGITQSPKERCPRLPLHLKVPSLPQNQLDHSRITPHPPMVRDSTPACFVWRCAVSKSHQQYVVPYCEAYTKVIATQLTYTLGS